MLIWKAYIKKKNLKKLKKEEANSKSKIVGEEVELIAKDKNKIKGSDIEADKIKIKVKKLLQKMLKEKTNISKDSTKS